MRGKSEHVVSFKLALGVLSKSLLHSIMKIRHCELSWPSSAHQRFIVSCALSVCYQQLESNKPRSLGSPGFWMGFPDHIVLWKFSLCFKIVVGHGR